MYNNNDDVSLHNSTKLCKQFTSYNFHPSPPPPEQCSWKAAVKWNNVNNNIPQQTIFFSLLFCWCSGASVLAAEKIRAFSHHISPFFHQPTFVCYYSILILFFSTLEYFPFHCCDSPHAASLRSRFFFFIAFFFFFHGSHDMEWRKLYCYLFSTVSHIHSSRVERSGMRRALRQRGMRRKICGVGCQWMNKRSRAEHKTSEWEYKKCEVKDEKHIFASSLAHNIIYTEQ